MLLASVARGLKSSRAQEIAGRWVRVVLRVRAIIRARERAIVVVGRAELFVRGQIIVVVVDLVGADHIEAPDQGGAVRAREAG